MNEKMTEAREDALVLAAVETMRAARGLLCSYRVVSTSTQVDRHIMILAGSLTQGLLCGEPHGGSAFVGDGVDDREVDCLTCLYLWTELTRPATSPPPGVEHGLGDCATH
jgi:hypothetical protein